MGKRILGGSFVPLGLTGGSAFASSLPCSRSISACVFTGFDFGFLSAPNSGAGFGGSGFLSLPSPNFGAGFLPIGGVAFPIAAPVPTAAMSLIGVAFRAGLTGVCLGGSGLGGSGLPPPEFQALLDGSTPQSVDLGFGLGTLGADTGLSPILVSFPAG